MEPELQRVLSHTLLPRLELAHLQDLRHVCKAVSQSVEAAPLHVWLQVAR